MAHDAGAVAVSARELIVGQAVVTDPTAAGTAGYSLVAASPSVSDAERHLLDGASGVTDALHRAEDPRTCFSFFPIDGGRWAFVRRFAAGRSTKLGTNRIVAHALLLDEAALAALAEDPWLLLRDCRFRRAGEAEEPWPLEAATQELSRPGLSRLDDLAMSPPPGVEDAAFADVMGRCRWLAGRPGWGDARTSERVAWMFDAVAAGLSVALPADPEHEQLLIVAWRGLPVRDRRRVRWTTHFAPGVPVRFHLVNAVEPASVPYDHADPAAWTLPGADNAPARTEIASRLAALLAADTSASRLLHDGMRLYRLSLLDDPATLRRFLAAAEAGDLLGPAGCADDRELSTLLMRLFRDGVPAELDPWLGEQALWSAAAGTARRLAEAGCSLAEAASRVAAAIEGVGLGARLTDALVLRDAAQELLLGDADSTVAGLALARRLATRARGQAPVARDALRAGLEAGGGASRAVRAATRQPEAAEQLVLLALELAADRSPRAREAMDELADLPGALASAVQRLRAEGRGPDAALTLLATILRSEPDLAAPLVADVVVPTLGEARAPLEDVHLSALDAGLDATWSRPEGVSSALETWDDPLRDRALAALRRGLRSHAPSALEAAAQAARALDDTALLQCAAAAGVTGALAEARAPSEVLARFALLEAVHRDAAAASPAAFLADVSLGALSSVGVARTLRSLQRSATEGRAGAHHRVLFQALGDVVAAAPSEAVAAVTAALSSGARDTAAWIPLGAHAVGAVERAGAGREAARLRSGVLLGAARHDCDAFTADVVTLLQQLADDDAASRERVLEAFRPALKGLRRRGSDAIVTELVSLATSLGPETGFRVLVELLEADVAAGRLPFARACTELDRAAARLSGADAWLGGALTSLVKVVPEGAWQAVLEALTSDAVPPSVKLAMEERVVTDALKATGRDRPFPSFARLARDAGALLAVASSLGRDWRAHADEAAAFLTDAVAAGRPDAVAALLLQSERHRLRGGLLEFLDDAGHDDTLHALATALTRPALRRRLGGIADRVARRLGLLEREVA